MKQAIWRWVLILFAASAPMSLWGKDYPTKPIRFIVPVAPGGTADILARAIAAKLSEAWGQPVYVDNRPGAGQIIGTTALAKAAPDGHTFGFVASTHSVNPHVNKSLPYDSIQDFVPVYRLAVVPNLIIVNKDVPVTRLSELVELAKTQPQQLTYGHPGRYSAGHLGMELLNKMAKIHIVGVPYQGGAPALNDLLAGHVRVLNSTPGSSGVYARTGRVRALATTGRKRSSAFPDIPTVAESGFEGYELYEWFGLFYPAGVAVDHVNRLHAEMIKIVKMPDIAKLLDDMGAEVGSESPASFSAFVRRENTRWADILKLLDLKPE